MFKCNFFLFARELALRGVKKGGSIEVSGWVTTYPSSKSILALTSHLGQSCDLGEE